MPFQRLTHLPAELGGHVPSAPARAVSGIARPVGPGQPFRALPASGAATPLPMRSALPTGVRDVTPGRVVAQPLSGCRGRQRDLPAGVLDTTPGGTSGCSRGSDNVGCGCGGGCAGCGRKPSGQFPFPSGELRFVDGPRCPASWNSGHRTVGIDTVCVAAATRDAHRAAGDFPAHCDGSESGQDNRDEWTEDWKAEFHSVLAECHGADDPAVEAALLQSICSTGWVDTVTCPGADGPVTYPFTHCGGGERVPSSVTVPFCEPPPLPRWSGPGPQRPRSGPPPGSPRPAVPYPVPSGPSGPVPIPRPAPFDVPDPEPEPPRIRCAYPECIGTDCRACCNFMGGGSLCVADCCGGYR